MALSKFPLSVIISAVDKVSSPLAKISGDLGRFGQKATAVGKTMSFALTAPIVGAGAAAVLVGASTERSLNKMRAAGVKSAEDLAKLKTAAKGFAGVGVSASEAAAGMVDLVKAGLDADEVLQTLPNSISIAKSEDIELARASELLVNAVSGLKMPMTEAGRVTDVLTTVADNTTTGFVDLAEGLKHAGPIAAGMGIRFEDLAATLGALGQAGFKGEMGGVALRGMLSDLANPSNETAEALSRLGIATEDMLDAQGNVKSLVGALQVLEQHGAITGDILQIFGDRGGPAMAALLGQGSEAVLELERALGSSAGAGQRKLAIMTEGAAGGMERLIAQAKNLGQAVADSGLLEWATKVIEKLGGLLEWVSQLDSGWLMLITVVGGVVAAIGPLLVAIGMISTGWGALTTGIGIVLPALGALATFIFTTAIPAIASMTIALLTFPGTWILAAIAAVVGGVIWLWKNWDKVVQWFGDAWDWLVDKVKWWADMHVKMIMWLVDKAKALLPDWLLDLFGSDGETKIITEEAAASAAGARTSIHETKESRVTVEFDGLPEGARLRADRGGDVDLSLGHALVAG